jgi:DNA-binding transcriptional MerR regulator
MNAKKAAFVAGFRSQLMLDYLERQGLFEREEVRSSRAAKDRRRGRHRDYTFRDVVVLRAINQLLDKGVSVERIKSAVISFSRDDKFQCDRRRLRYDDSPIQYLVTDGRQLYFRKDGTGVTSILEGGQEAFFFVLDVRNAQEFVDKRDPEKKKRARAGKRA